MGDALAAARRGTCRPCPSLAALVCALAFGEPVSSGRERRRGVAAPPLRGQTDAGDGLSAWRLATEVFAAGGWHLRGSLLRLDCAGASRPAADESGRRAGAVFDGHGGQAVVREDHRADPGGSLGDAARDAVAAAIARGSGRVADLGPRVPEGSTRSEPTPHWRVAGLGIRWLLATDPARVPAAFTTLDLFGSAADARAGLGRRRDALPGVTLCVPGARGLGGIHRARAHGTVGGPALRRNVADGGSALRVAGFRPC